MELRTSPLPSQHHALFLLPSQGSVPCQRMAVWPPNPKVGFDGVLRRRGRFCGICVAKRGASQPRGTLWRGRNISKEGMQAVQDLKRAAADPQSLKRVLHTGVARLLKNDLLEVFEELLRQNECFLALQIFQVIRKEPWYRPDVFLYKKMMHSLGRRKQIEEVQTLFNESVDEGLEPGLLLFTELLAAYLRADMALVALEVYEEMKSKGLQADRIIYTLLVKGLRRAGEVSLASNVMVEFSKDFPEASKELQVAQDIKSAKEILLPS